MKFYGFNYHSPVQGWVCEQELYQFLVEHTSKSYKYVKNDHSLLQFEHSQATINTGIPMNEYNSNIYFVIRRDKPP